ncbi:GGDEF domain-containing protein [Deinococcus radiotolerans]|nr:GGDEF domain-containing protein [Deinococcus radiotolerans]
MAAVPILAALLQLSTGETQRFIYDLFFLIMVLTAQVLNQRPGPLGSVLLLLLLPIVLVWFHTPQLETSLFAFTFTTYSASLILPTLLAAVSLGLQGVWLFSLYALTVGGLSLEVLPAEGSVIACITFTGLVAGSLMAWLLTVTERTLNHAQRSALLDPLTELGNRRAFEAALLAAWQAGPTHIGLAFLDLDGLKAVNDQHGHDVGDVLIRTVAQAVHAQLQAGQAVFRLAGDEFVVVCTHGDLSHIWHQIRAAVTEVRRQGFPEADVSVGLSSGVRAESISALMRQADLRMYAEKRRKGQRRAQAEQRGERPS